MREIKFRAWDKKNKEMIDGKWFTVHSQGNAIILIKDEMLEPHFNDEYELMQYTGLNDKNKVEIYEGDICTIEDDCIYVIKWKGLGFWFEQQDFDRQCYIFTPEHYFITVIGNIYENKNLLK